jgi:hypothetical protein
MVTNQAVGAAENGGDSRVLFSISVIYAFLFFVKLAHFSLNIYFVSTIKV